MLHKILVMYYYVLRDIFRGDLEVTSAANW